MVTSFKNHLQVCLFLLIKSILVSPQIRLLRPLSLSAKPPPLSHKRRYTSFSHSSFNVHSFRTPRHFDVSAAKEPCVPNSWCEVKDESHRDVVRL